jgi:hypothetical protein
MREEKCIKNLSENLKGRAILEDRVDVSIILKWIYHRTPVPALRWGTYAGIGLRR